MSDPGRLRASDVEREQAGESLREHYGAGRLGYDELSARLDALYGARTVSEVPALLHDLPALRNGWRLYGPAPELDRVEAELRRQSRHRGRHRHRQRHLQRGGLRR